MNNVESEIKTLLTNYYYKIYKVFLGLSDYQDRIESRLKEDIQFFQRINTYRKYIPFFSSNIINKKILILGAGTGCELKYFNDAGCEIYAIEPDEEAFNILLKKAQYYKIPANRIIMTTAESLPFEGNFFDFVWSWTVLEHVKNYKLVLNEIIRVMKFNSWGFLEFPDYRQFYEGHYKTYIPLYLPKWMIKFFLFLKRRPTGYFNHLNMINGLNFVNIIRDIGLIGFQIVFPKNKNIKNLKFGEKQVEKITVKKGIQLNQNWVIYKPE